MEWLTFLITYLPDIIYAVVGIVGYYTGFTWLLSVVVILILVNTIIHNLNIFTLVLHAIACAVGLIIALFFNLSIFRTIEVAICFEWLIRQVIYHISTLIASKKK